MHSEYQELKRKKNAHIHAGNRNLWYIWAYFENNVIGTRHNVSLFKIQFSIFIFGVKFDLDMFQKFHPFHVSYINHDDWPDGSHSRQEMTSVWPELMEFTSQGWSVSMMCIIWLRSAAEKPSFHKIIILLIQYLNINKLYVANP